MKKIYSSLLLLASMVFAIGANGQTVFNYTGDFVTYTVPAGVASIGIEALGAQGASGSTSFVGGQGAKMYGEFAVNPGDVLIIAVGGMGQGQGSGSNGGGGGGTFVVIEDAAGSYTFTGGAHSGTSFEPLIIAGGGGGTRTGASQDGHPGVITETATTASGGSGTGGGATSAAALGAGGIVSAVSYGSGGGGLTGNGADDVSYGQGGQSFISGALGGNTGSCGDAAAGGFGGGGQGRGCYGGGGGGGYTGGDGGWISGGGGSYNDGTNQDNAEGFNPGDGQVTITELCNAVTVTVSADTICYGDSLLITATSSVGGTITWDNGAMNGVSFLPDTTGLVTYTSSSDTTDCGAVVEVFIQEAPDFTLGSTDEILGGDGSTFITITGGSFPFTFDWDIDGTGDFDDDQNQNGLSAGTYTVTVMSGNGCTATDSVVINSQLGLDANALISELVYPSPTEDIVNIELPGEYTYTVMDALGRTIIQGEANGHEKISLADQENGVYLISININGQSRQVKVVKK